MKKIHISADREYDVHVDVEAQPTIENLAEKRSRVAVFFS